jgi:hypothetical protein
MPSNGKYKHMVIRFTLGGAIVKIGCQRIPFTRKDALISAFTDYINDPEKAERNWLDDDWSKHGEDQTPL